MKAITKLMTNEAKSPTEGSTPATKEKAMTSGMSANVATAPASSSRGMLGAHSARRRVRVEGFLRCALQKTKHARRRAERGFR